MNGELVVHCADCDTEITCRECGQVIRVLDAAMTTEGQLAILLGCGCQTESGTAPITGVVEHMH